MSNFRWSDWNYNYWNSQLVERWLCVDEQSDLLVVPIDRIPAMPEQLALIVGADAAEANAVADAFITQVKKELPPGTSFCGYCDDGPWTPESTNPPHFFGMLWFTCLVAYGYPFVEGSFDNRFVRVFGRT